ncbi:hypothetical protein [Bartonella sp. HY761]|uniref:hypothetical protein n=1 Tax=Bartonella sp. HY761 TaxID=2979330 RepID=UPI0021FE0DC3|nr:hypothetical protein [Bartonella sp. HY761]UXN05148.1 hypothetical protein N6A79_07365 [Bartonella sp. HY761]
MEENTITFKIALMQPIEEFLKASNLPDRFLIDRYLLLRGNENDFNNGPCSIIYNNFGWGEKPRPNYIIELLDLGCISLPTVQHVVFTIEDGCITEIISQMCFQLPLDEVKAMVEPIYNSFQQAGYYLKYSQIEMTEESFVEDRPLAMLTYAQWQIAGKQDECRYKLQIFESDSLSDPKKYSLVFKAQVITETMRQTFEARKAYRLEMQKKMNENLPKN